MIERLEPDLKNSLMSHARAIVATDGDGKVLWTEGDGVEADLGLRLDLLASTLRRLATRREAGPLDSVLVRMEDELMMMVAVPSGYVAIFADASMTPGLLFTHVRRLQSALGVAA